MDEPHKTHADDALRNIGALILALGQLETQLTMSMIDMQPDIAGPHISEKSASRMLQAIINKWHTVFSDTTACGQARAKALKERMEQAALKRNTIAHGSDGLWLDTDDYAVVCFERFHHNRMTGRFPPQRTIPRAELHALIAEVHQMTQELRELTALARSQPRKPKAQKATK